MQTYLPKYFSQRAIAVYVLLLLTVSVVFSRYMLKWYWMLMGLVEVAGFFYFSQQFSQQWQRYSVNTFAKRLFTYAFVIRAVYVFFSYWFYLHMTGSPMVFHAADAAFYVEMGRYGAGLLRDGHFNLYSQLQAYSGAAYSDLGYPMYLSVVYLLTNDSLIMERLLKAALGAWTVVLTYRLAQRNFAESTARLAAIFCMLMPNLIYYCGIDLKEIEMVFLEMLFIERADYVLRQGKLVLPPLLVVIVSGMYLFMFRTVLAAVLFISFFLALTLSSTRVVKWGRRALLLLLGVLFVGVVFRNRIMEEVNPYTQVELTPEESQYAWRAEREGGNQFAKYASTAVLAPMLFTVPFPTMVTIPEQEHQMMIHGGNYVKNITSLFTILALFMLILPYDWKKNLLEGEWRKHILPMAALGGYLIVLVFSNFAHSERFHQPTLNLAMMFAAYGIANFDKRWKSLYLVWLLIIFIAGVAWSWFKLRGRGM